MGENKEKGNETPRLPKEVPIKTIEVTSSEKKKENFTGEQKKKIS